MNEITIHTVKEQIDLETNKLIGYLVDSTKSVPLTDSNRDYQEVLKWLAEGNIPEPEFTEEEIAQQELQVKLQEAKGYLNSTDWYYARKAETGEDAPVEVVAKRVECRAFLRSNQ